MSQPRILLFRGLSIEALDAELRSLGTAPKFRRPGVLLRVLQPSPELSSALSGWGRARADLLSVEVQPPAVPGRAMLLPDKDLELYLRALGEKMRVDITAPPSPLLPAVRPAILGIVNITPDSFSDGGRHLDADAAVEHALALVAAGADLLDFGGESTRPGAQSVDAAEELSRVLPVLEKVLDQTSVPLSIDTRKPEVAQEALAAGCTILNDVGGLRDPRMAKVAAETGAAVICMHMAGEPDTMQKNPHYDDLFGEIALSLARSAETALEAGIPREKIWLDPGLGFGKTFAHNLRLIRGLSGFTSLGFQLVFGSSRKSFLTELSDGAPAGERLVPSVVTAVAAARQGASVLRVHDVAETRRALRTALSIENGAIAPWTSAG